MSLRTEYNNNIDLSLRYKTSKVLLEKTKEQNVFTFENIRFHVRFDIIVCPF